MKQALCLTALLSLGLLAACGGGSSPSTSNNSSSTGSYSFSTASANVVALSVNPGPGSTTGCDGQSCQTFNIPLVTVTVCEPNTSTCATIPNVLVDTGSSGLRLMASVLASANANMTLPSMHDPNGSGDAIAECLLFADGYAWGSVATATVTIGGETTTGAIPVQIIDDNNSGPPAPNNKTGPTCVTGMSLDSVNAFDANGVLGVSTANQDCGNDCVDTGNENYDLYWSCTSGGSCNPSTDLPLTDQVANPVASFPTDNNGVIVQLASISANGATTGSGYLVFGIGTESNNALQSATVITANEAGEFSTTLSSQSLAGSFIDSGSNALFFNDSTDSSLVACGSTVQTGSDFYCPTSTQSFSATNQGSNGTESTVSFQVADLIDINNNYFAIDDVAGPAPTIPGSPTYFDFGLPFFYGRTVFVAIEGLSAGGTKGPYYAY